MRILLFATITATLMSCASERSCRTDAWSDACLEELGSRFVADQEFRRSEALRSLQNPDNLYSRQRIAGYGLGDRGWDALPEWNPVSMTVDHGTTLELASGRAVTLPRNAEPVWKKVPPTNHAEWIALGQEVFFRYPVRDDAFVEHHLRTVKPEGSQLTPLKDGRVIGAVVYRDVEGEAKIGISCALCHTSAEAGDLVIGAARRGLDYGAIRVALFDSGNTPLGGAERARQLSWGPGRADITEDEDGDPVAIPDLWGLKEQTALTQSGAIIHKSPVALAIRQETQLIHANHERTRPPRELAWALAMYLYSLEPPRAAVSEPDISAGREIFSQQCASCHSNAAFGGPPIDAAVVATDRRLTDGVARGTGLYRPPALLALASAAPYLHDGSVASLEELLSAERLAPEYTGGLLGPGPIPGHSFGVDLPYAERAALLRYLRSL